MIPDGRIAPHAMGYVSKRDVTAFYRMGLSDSLFRDIILKTVCFHRVGGSGYITLRQGRF